MDLSWDTELALEELQAGKSLLVLPSPHPCSLPMPLSRFLKGFPTVLKGKKAGESILWVLLSPGQGWLGLPPRHRCRDVAEGPLCATSVPARTELWDPPSCHPQLTVLGMWTSGFM